MRSSFAENSEESVSDKRESHSIDFEVISSSAFLPSRYLQQKVCVSLFIRKF